jgi:hypothetical protein
MKLIFHISKDQLVTTYRKVKAVLDGNDAVLFAAMAAVSPSFTAPRDAGEYRTKHAEIERIFNFPDALRGRSTAIGLMEQLGEEVRNRGGLVGMSYEQLVEIITFQSTDGTLVRLTPDLRWAVEWRVPVNQGGINDDTVVSLDVYDRTWGEVVPSYVLQYVHSGIVLYRQRMNAVAVALLSIAVEATLRDVLASRDYHFSPGASSVDIFEYSRASVAACDTGFTLTFEQAMPKSSADFPNDAGTSGTVEIRTKRVINVRDHSLHLKVEGPELLLDYWSSNIVLQAAQKRVNGLGEALRIARQTEGVVTPTMLPTDFDEVISIVRNNLIHLSADTLAIPLTTLDPSGGFTLGQFLENQLMVHDLVTNVPRFINEQYIQLRTTGHLMS